MAFGYYLHVQVEYHFSFVIAPNSGAKGHDRLIAFLSYRNVDFKESNVSVSSKKKVWVAVSSLAGVIATTLGVLAVFYPDALNLQKKQMQQLDLEIVDRADVDTLDAFLDKNVNKIVQLSIALCRTRDESDLPVVESPANALIVRHDDCEEGTMCTSTTYYLSNSDLADDRNGVWMNDKFAACRKDEHGGLFVASGYFMVPSGAGFGQGNLEWMLTPIEKSQIALKDY